MSRRRLRLNWSSDEDNENDLQYPNSSAATSLQPLILDNLNSHFNPNVSEPLPLSDDDDDDQDFIDVSDHLSPPSPDSDHSLRQSPQLNPLNSTEPSCPVSEFLGRFGLSLKREWFDACIRAIQGSTPGFLSLDPSEKGKLCFEHFLVSDMNYSGAGVLPENIDSMHLVDLPGPYVLQVDEIVNISCPLKGRYQTAAASVKRCLKLSMTDGVQRVFGMEYRPIKDLEVLAPAGLKVVIRNATVRHGLLMLVPEALEVLGGLVEELEAARQRLVVEVKKPPRGKRTRTGVIPPLASRATRAAWSSDTIREPGHPTGTVGNEPFHSDQGVGMFHRGNEAFTAPVGDARATPVSRTNENSERSSNFVSNVGEIHLHSVPRGNEVLTARVDANSELSSNFVSNVEEIHSHSVLRRNEAFTAPVDANSELSSSFVSNVEEIHSHSVPRGNEAFTAPIGDACATPVSRANANSELSSNFVSNVEEIHSHYWEASNEHTIVSNSEEDTNMVNLVGDTDMDNLVDDANMVRLFEDNVVNSIEDTNMVDIEHPLILSGDREIPFTYLASLSVMWAAVKEKSPSVRGKIKCFLAGVKGFQFKERTTYELHVYVDDGSLISEVIVDHEAVQKEIGHSPKDVTDALASSDVKVVKGMKETMRQFQVFLVNFEGTMLIEMNRTSSLPVVIEIEEGCLESDAWLLLRRFKSSFAVQTQEHSRMDPVDVSP